MTGDQLVSAYLARLEAAAGDLPADRRAELLDDVRDHVEGARAAGAAADEAAVRTLLDRLGTPEELVAAARQESGHGWGAPPPVLKQRGTGLELAAVLLLTVGSLVPLLGWLAGAALLVISPLWRRWEKAVGLLVWPLGPFGLLYFGGVFVTQTCSSSVEIRSDGTRTESAEVCTGAALPTPLAVVVVALLVLAPVVVAVLLYRTARRRAAAAAPVPVAPRPSPWGGLELAGVLVLGVGGWVFPVALPLVGLALVLASRAWSRRDKAVGAAITVLPVLVVALSFALPFVGTGPVGPLLPFGFFSGFLGLLFGPSVAAGWFALRLSRRTATL